MAKPSIIVNGGTPGAMTSVSASTAWTATLDSIDGVRQVEWAITSTDETTTAGSHTLVQSGSVGQTVASTSQGQGTGVILWVRVNNGLVGDQPDPTNTEATIKIVVPLPDGGIVGCAGEEYESDSTFGATGIINQGIRKAALLSPSGVPVKIVRAATAAALPANTRTGNVLTADADGAIGTVGGVALVDGDYCLVQNEGGGASHVNNGVYVLANGDGSNPWEFTRATYFDDSAELIAMTTFRIQEGTYAGKERYLVTSGATINVTALEFAAFGYAPNDAAYLTVGAVSDLSAERNISAVTSTLTFESTTVAPLGAKRTDSATAALVDVAEATALSSGTAAAGFGPSVKFLGEVSGGGAENYGRVGFAATDLTGGSEDTKFVAQARTAGSALATVFEASGTSAKLPGIATGSSGLVAIAADGTLSRTASSSGLDANAHVLEDASTALGVNGVPMRAAPSTVGFVGVACAPISLTHKTAAAAGVTEGLRIVQQINAGGVGNPGVGGEAVKLAFALPNGSGAETLAASVRGEWTTVIGGGTSKIVLATALAGTETDRATLGGTGLWRWHAYGVGRILSDASGNLTSTAITFTEVQTALAAASGSIAVNSQKITGLTAGASSGEAVEYSQLGTTVNAAVSGTTNALAKFTAAHVVGDSGVTDDGTTVNTTRTVTFTGDSIGSTQTRGVTLINNTVSGTQYTRQHGFTAFHSGGTQWNIGSRLEVVNASHARQIWYYGSGSAVPSSEILRLDTQDDNFGALVRGPVFAASATGGYRFDFANNRGGLKYNSGSDYIYLESYNTKDLRFYTGADSGGSGGVLRMIWNGTGQGYAQFVPTTPTSSSNAMTINLTTSQNVEHTLTENTTVTITGGVNGQRGTIVFSQPASAKTVTMPTNGSGVEYDNTLTALGGGTYQPAIVDTTNLTRTVLNYYVLANGKAFIYSRSVALIP